MTKLFNFTLLLAFISPSELINKPQTDVFTVLIGRQYYTLGFEVGFVLHKTKKKWL